MIDHGSRGRIYSPAETYTILYQGLRTERYARRAKKTGELSSALSERIMLAVTEVNGCDVCSYVHTKIALEQGMSEEEIQMLLAGNAAAIPADEAVAIAFAQHYADAKGHPTRESWRRVVDSYGAVKANGIIGSIRTIMIGNAYGIAWGALVNRLKGRPVRGSSLLHEVSMLLSMVVFLPVALLHAAISDLSRVPLISWRDDLAPSADTPDS